MSTEEPAASPVQETPAAEAAPAPATTETEAAPARPTRSKSKSGSPVKKSVPPASDAKPQSTTSKPKAAAPKKAAPASAATGSENKTFKYDDIVLARLKGYPPWPARIADPETASKAVRDSRPSKNNQLYLCHYFPAGDFSWCHAKDINHLKAADIDGYINQKHRKISGMLREAYLTAKDPSEWLSEQEALQREAEMDIDELAEEDEEEDGQAGGKRKRGTVSAASKKSKKAKSTKKEEPASKSKAKTKKAAAPASAPEQAPADDDPLASDPECVKVKDWRHKLQRAFLGKSLPTAPEMDTYNDIFNTIESYKDMTIEALQYSKIGKVMKKITTLEGIPRNDELKITDRASKLMNEWHDFIANSNGANGTNGDAPKSESKVEEPKKPAEESAANGSDEKAEVEA